MSKDRLRQKRNRERKKQYELNCSRFSSRDLNPIPEGGIKPHNCSTPCPYGNGRTFCFPCMAKIMNEHRTRRKAA